MDVKPWLFPQLLDITKRWLAECVVCKDDTFPQLLLLVEFAHDAADRIYRAIVAATPGDADAQADPAPVRHRRHRPATWTSTRRKPVFDTDPAKCHISHVVADTGSWEQKLAQTLEECPRSRATSRTNLGFTIPYTLNGDERQYYPDFIVRRRRSRPATCST